MVFKGRLGLDTARVPHADRHGLMWLDRGRLSVENGNLTFTTAGSDILDPGAYAISSQQISNILLGPGGVVTHDALRILAQYDTGLLAVGAKGVRLYAASMPFGPDRSARARHHARLWADESSRIDVARAMYRKRLGAPPAHHRDLDSLRGIEGARVKQTYRNLAAQYGVEWNGRVYDRNRPETNDVVNKCINHVAVAMYAAARVAVAVAGALPQLGFIHESSGHAFALDIADLYRSTVTVPVAFRAAKQWEHRFREFGRDRTVESVARKLAGAVMYDDDIVPGMIDDIKELLDESSFEPTA